MSTATRFIFILISSIVSLTISCAAIAGIELATVNMDAGKGRLINLSRNAKAVMIANDEIADFQLAAPDKLYLIAKIPGQTSLTVLDNKREVIYQATITVSANLQVMAELLNRIFPNEKDVHLSIALDKVIVRGKVRSPRTAENIISLLQGYVTKPEAVINQLQITMPTQVHVQLRLAEMSRTISNRLGIRWGSINPAGSILIADRFSVVKKSISDTLGAGAGNQVAGILEALNTRGLAKLLAEPSLTAMSGESANFLAGGEFPIPVYDGRDRIVVTYKQFGVLLEVKPTVLDDGRISIKVIPEVSSLDFQSSINASGISLPTLKTRRAETTVELASGQSFVLAGLLRNDDINNFSELPFLADIPVLGALFRSNDFKREETELVVIATAYLVEPGRPGEFELPTDSFQRPSALERLLFGRFQHKNSGLSPKNKTYKTRLIGDNGFYY